MSAFKVNSPQISMIIILSASELVPLAKADAFFTRKDLHERFCQFAVEDFEAVLASGKIIKPAALVPGSVEPGYGFVVGQRRRSRLDVAGELCDP